jgi:hypothetical protein
VILDSFVDGRIPEDAYPAMVEEIQNELGVMGHSSVLAGSLTWSPATQGEETRRVVISVRSREGETRVRVEEQYEIRGFRRLFIGMGALSGVLIAALVGTVLGVSDASVPALLIPCVGLGVAGGVFGTIKFEANTRRPQLEALSQRLTLLAQEAVRESPGGTKKLGPV